MLQHGRISTALALATLGVAFTVSAAAEGTEIVPRADVVEPAISPAVTGSPDARDAARGSYVSRGPSVDLRSPDTRDAATGRGALIGVRSPVVQIVPAASGAHGFDWGDAGIGAGGAIAFILLLTGGALLLVHRRHEHAGPSAPSGLAT